MPNSSSSAITSSTVSRESAPRSAMKAFSLVTSASGTPSCSAMIFLTRASISLMTPPGVENGKTRQPAILAAPTQSSPGPGGPAWLQRSLRRRTPSLHEHAAVDVQFGAGDVARLRAGQEGHRVGDLFGGAQAPQRNLLQQRG